MKRILLVFGTRPEAIKMCPLVKEFQKYPDEFETVACVTGQHREMLDQVLRIFEFPREMIPAVDAEGQKTCNAFAEEARNKRMKITLRG